MNNVTNAKKNRRPEVSFKEKDAGERWVRLTRETQDTSWDQVAPNMGPGGSHPQATSHQEDGRGSETAGDRTLSQLEDERAASLEVAVADKHQSREVDC